MGSAKKLREDYVRSALAMENELSNSVVVRVTEDGVEVEDGGVAIYFDNNETKELRDVLNKLYPKGK